MYKHPKNVSRRFQKDISPRTKDIKHFSQLITDGHTHTHMSKCKADPTRGGSAKNTSLLHPLIHGIEKWLSWLKQGCHIGRAYGLIPQFCHFESTFLSRGPAYHINALIVCFHNHLRRDIEVLRTWKNGQYLTKAIPMFIFYYSRSFDYVNC